MINELMALANATYRETGRRVRYIYLGPREYAAVTADAAKHGVVPCEGENPILSIGGHVVIPSQADGIILR